MYSIVRNVIRSYQQCIGQFINLHNNRPESYIKVSVKGSQRKRLYRFG